MVDQLPEVRVHVSTCLHGTGDFLRLLKISENLWLNVWKFFGKLRKKHRRVQKTNIPTSFRKFFKNLWNLRKSSEISGRLRTSSEKIGKCRKVLKTTFQHFLNFLQIFGNHRKSTDVFGNLRKNSENFGNRCKVLETTFQHFWNFLKIFGNCRKSSEIFGKIRKKSENVGKFSKRSSDTFWKLSKIFGNLRKSSEMLGKLRKPSENFRMLSEVYEFFLWYSNLWHQWTEDQIQEFWFVICTGITLFALLSANQNQVFFSCTLLVEGIIRLWVQFGIYLYKWDFQKVSKFNEAAGRVKFELFEKLTSAN